MKVLWVMFFVCLTTGIAQDDLPELPAPSTEVLPGGDEPEEVLFPDPISWTPGDWQALQDGELVSGYYLLGLPSQAGQDYFPSIPSDQLDLPEPETGDEPDGIDRSWISQDALLAYFARKPERELMDPQGLLSQQSYNDRAAFLEYHRRDSDVPIYIYLFDGSQEVPAGYDVNDQLRSQLSDQGPALLAYYFLGRPDKAEVAISPSLRDQLSLLEYRRILDTAIREASEKSDPVDQLEGFAVQLSIRMYWVERNLREAKQKQTLLSGLADILPASKGGAPAQPGAGKEATFRRFGPWIFGAFVISIAAALGFVGRRISLGKRRYTFPEPDAPVRLDAPHAAGIGAVIHFRSPQIPPSSQREQVPDYLQRY